MNIVAGLPFLDGVESDKVEVRLAVEFLETIRGIQRLGISGFSAHDMTGKQFALVNYLSARIDEYQKIKR